MEYTSSDSKTFLTLEISWLIAPIKKLLIDNENLRNEVGAQALYDLEKNYSYNAVKDLYLNILNSV